MDSRRLSSPQAGCTSVWRRRISSRTRTSEPCPSQAGAWCWPGGGSVGFSGFPRSSGLALHGPFQGTWGGMRGSAGEKPVILAASRREGPGDPLSRKARGWGPWGEGHPCRPASPTHSAGEPHSLWEGCRGLELQRVTLGSPRPFPCRFWALLERYLPTHSICSLPFVTSFCLGMGTRRVCYGQVRGLPGGAASQHTGCPPSVFGLTWERWGARGVGGMAAMLLPPPGAPGTPCPVGPQPSLTWPSPPGGGGGALVPPKRPGNPAPVCRAQAGRGRAGLGEDALLPGGRLERGQLPAHPRGDSARGRTRGCEVGECVGATPVGPSASPSPLSITHLGRWAAVARRRTEDGTEAILIVVKST